MSDRASPRGHLIVPRHGAARAGPAAADAGPEAVLSDAEIAAIVERAVVDTYWEHVADDPAIRARVDVSRGSFEVYRVAEDGAEEVVPSQDGDFRRHAAQAAKLAMMRRLNEVEKDRIMGEASLQQGELIDTIVEHRGADVWHLRAGETEAILPRDQQMEGEELSLRQHVKVVVIEGRRRAHDAILVVSRSHPRLLRLLLEQEVPELQNGEVVIRAMVREAGRRSKVAVEATRAGIDAQGACIGPRGVRHRAVTAELRDEQVQIIAWSEDAAEYVGNALAPAVPSGVEIEPSTMTARVTVAGDQLSLAIGRGGENARLAARLTGWRVDIVPARPVGDGTS
ncbi:MAG: transcription termination/antitermination protein NusA [Candidatus Dormibacteria bacterium]